MIKHNGKQYRNLEEQVEWNKNEIEKLESANGLLGIRVVGQIEDVEDLPAEDSEVFAELLYGDTYIVGTNESNYNYYVKTRPNEETPYPHWFNIGNIAPKMVVIAGDGEGSIITEGNEAVGDKAVAFGNNTAAAGDAATSLGTDTVATGPASLATGEDGEANGEASFITGSLFYNGTTPDLTHPHKANGNANIVGGMGNKSDGDATLVMGSKNITDNTNSIITGVGNEVIDEGNSNIIGGINNDVSTVDNTIIAGASNDVQNVQDSIIVGNGNESQNESGHKVVILGSNNKTVDSTAAIIGNNLSVNDKNNVVVLGKYNDPTTIEAKDVLVIGGGVSNSTRKNILKVNSDGEIIFENDSTISPITISTIWNSIEDKQDRLTFDTAPTADSTNPVTSGGVYQAIQDVAGNYVTFDDVATSNSLGVVKLDQHYDATSNSAQTGTAVAEAIAATNASLPIVDTITVTEDTAAVTKTGLNLSEMYIEMYAAAAANSADGLFKLNGIYTLYFQNGQFLNSSSGGTIVKVNVENRNGIRIVNGLASRNVVISNDSAKQYRDAITRTTTKINSIEISSLQSATPIPAGTTVTIYGR